MSIPTLLLVMDIHLPTPEKCSGWCDWQMIIQCSPEDVAGHLWVWIGSPRPGEQAEAGVSSRQDKGKGWEVHPMSETQAEHLTHVPELQGWPAGPSQGHGHSQSHSHSQSHCPCKVIKSTDHINSNDEVVDASAEGELQVEACAIPHQATYDLKDPLSRINNIKLTHLPAEQACALCACRSLPCTISAPQFSCYQTSKSPGPLMEPLKIRSQPPSHKRKGCSSSTGPSHTKVPCKMVTPAWLVKGHLWNVSPNPSEAMMAGTMPTCSRCTECSSRVDDLESEVTGLRWDLEASNQWHEAHDCKVDALRDLVEHLWAHVFQP
ncbi:hypothetical protein J3A83DRAFT_4189809 [Scleroderma citrinum]